MSIAFEILQAPCANVSSEFLKCYVIENLWSTPALHCSSGVHPESDQNRWYDRLNTSFTSLWSRANWASHSHKARSHVSALSRQVISPRLRNLTLYATRSPIHCSPWRWEAHRTQSLYCLQTLSIEFNMRSNTNVTLSQVNFNVELKTFMAPFSYLTLRLA